MLLFISIGSCIYVITYCVVYTCRDEFAIGLLLIIGTSNICKMKVVILYIYYSIAFALCIVYITTILPKCCIFCIYNYSIALVLYIVYIATVLP